MEIQEIYDFNEQSNVKIGWFGDAYLIDRYDPTNWHYVEELTGIINEFSKECLQDAQGDTGLFFKRKQANDLRDFLSQRYAMADDQRGLLSTIIVYVRKVFACFENQRDFLGEFAGRNLRSLTLTDFQRIATEQQWPPAYCNRVPRTETHAVLDLDVLDNLAVANFLINRN